MKLNNSEKFAEEFIQEYLRDAFGCFNKKEIELLIFKIILKDQGMYYNFDKFKVSKLLKISETKVVSLYRELQLRDEDFNDIWFEKELKKLLENSKLELSTEKIILQVNNPFLKLKIEEFFNSNGVIVDYSFNKNILKINVDAFIYLLKEIIEKEELDKIEKLEKDKFNNLMKIALENFVKGAYSQAGKKVVDLGSIVLTGGIESIISFVNSYIKKEQIR